MSRKVFGWGKQVRFPKESDFFVLSGLSPGVTQRRLAVAVVLGALTVFTLIAVGPLKGVQLRRVDAFIPAYATAMFVCQSLTAILLYTQFSLLRSPAILVMASGYLFAALVLIPFILAYPGVFVPGRGLFGGTQSTSWVWCFWHTGFPLFTIGYALLKEDKISGRGLWRGTVGAQIAVSVALTTAIVVAAAFFVLAGEALLPQVAFDYGRFSPLWPYFIGAPVVCANVSALIVLWVRRQSILDLWLIVVICLYLIEVPLAYYPNPIRFSVGSYAIRIIGVLASGLVLAVLLCEIAKLYSRLLSAVLGYRREREARLMTGEAVAASIAHEIKQPLSAMIMHAEAGLRFLNRPLPNLDDAKEALMQISADGHRAGALVGSIQTHFKNEGRNRVSLDLNDLIEETLGVMREELEKHRIEVRADLDKNLRYVRGDPIQLQQVLVNLITNAADSMANVSGSRVLTIKSEVMDNGEAQISVADTGSGVCPEDVHRIFNPLVTTKPGGMGMGLAICQSIIEAHEGRLSVAPATSGGAIFHFTLVRGA